MNGSSRLDPEGATGVPLGPPPPLHPVVNPASPVNGGHGHGGVTPPPIPIGAPGGGGVPSLHDVKSETESMEEELLLKWDDHHKSFFELASADYFCVSVIHNHHRWYPFSSLNFFFEPKKNWKICVIHSIRGFSVLHSVELRKSNAFQRSN